MRERSFNRVFAFYAALCVAVAFFVAIPTRAGFVDDAEYAIDQTDALPFKFGDWKPILAACNGDDMVTCADLVSQSQTAQSAGVPSYLPQMINIYFDVKNKDYWGLLADAGETVACAAAEILTDVDICGAIKTLVDAAEAVASTAEAAAKFLADFGGAVLDGLKEIGCGLGLGGCDDGPSGPTATPDQLAQAFLATQVPPGVKHIKNSFNEFVDFRSQLADVGQTQGLSYPKIINNLAWYDGQVNVQWDAWIIQTKLEPYAKAISQVNDPSTLDGFVSGGTKHLKEIDWNPNLDPKPEPYDDATRAEIMTMLSPLWADTISYCDDTLNAAGGARVKEWLGQSRPQALGFPPPADPNQTCQKFNFNLKKQLAGVATLGLMIHWTQGCTKDTHGNYSCDSKLDNFRCNAAFFFVEGKLSCGAGGPIGQPSGSSSSGGPAPEQHTFEYLCGPKNTLTKSASDKPPPGCHRIPPFGGPGGMGNNGNSGSPPPHDNH